MMQNLYIQNAMYIQLVTQMRPHFPVTEFHSPPLSTNYGQQYAGLPQQIGPYPIHRPYPMYHQFTTNSHQQPTPLPQFGMGLSRFPGSYHTTGVQLIPGSMQHPMTHGLRVGNLPTSLQQPPVNYAQPYTCQQPPPTRSLPVCTGNTYVPPQQPVIVQPMEQMPQSNDQRNSTYLGQPKETTSTHPQHSSARLPAWRTPNVDKTKGEKNEWQHAHQSRGHQKPVARESSPLKKPLYVIDLEAQEIPNINERAGRSDIRGIRPLRLK